MVGYGKASDGMEVIMMHSLDRKGKDQRGWAFCIASFGIDVCIFVGKGNIYHGEQVEPSRVVGSEEDENIGGRAE